MRILHIDTGREMRGGQFQTLFLLRELVRLGHDCTLLAPREAPIGIEAAAAGARTLDLRFRWLLANARSFDIVHAHTARAHTLAAVTGAHPLVVARRVAFPVRKSRASRWKYRRADRFIAVSEYVKRKLVEADVPEEKVSVVYDGVPLLPERRSEELVVAPASADPAKGVRLAQESAELAEVELHFSTDLVSDFARAAVLLYLTDMEGLGSGALLAMSAGVPVIASNVGGLPEVVEDGSTGLLVPNDRRSVAAAIQRLMKKSLLRQDMGQRARQRVRERFTIEQMVQGTIRVYEEVMA